MAGEAAINCPTSCRQAISFYVQSVSAASAKTLECAEAKFYCREMDTISWVNFYKKLKSFSFHGKFNDPEIG